MILKLKIINTFKIKIWVEMSKVLLTSGTLIFAKPLVREYCVAPLVKQNRVWVWVWVWVWARVWVWVWVWVWDGLENPTS